MSRARLRTTILGASAALRARLASMADAVGLELLPHGRAIGTQEPSVAFLQLGQERPVGLDDVATVQAQSSDLGSTLLVLVVPVGVDAYIRGSLRRAGGFEVVEDGPDLEDDLAGLTHVARRVTQLEHEREQLVAELAHHDRLNTVGLLAAGVSHEINNPAAAILANTETVRDAIEQALSQPRFRQGEAFHRRAPEWLEALGETLAATRRVASIVSALNVFSRRKTDEALVETNVNAEVESVLRLVGKEVRLQAKVELELDADLLDLKAQPFAVTQVVTNLVVNALQSLEASTPDPAARRLRITTAGDEESVMIEVSDNGAGIPPEVLGRVFDPFFTTKPVGAGTGLGLSITRELVHRMGGEIFVESELGHGASFRVVLPLVRRPAASVRPMSEAPPPMLRHRVLLVDDDTALLRAIARSLNEHLECVAESSGDAAIARIRRGEHFDAILLDVVMPGIDGVDTWRAIGALDPLLAQRTIFFSGGVRVEERRQAVEATGQPMLPKPTEGAAILAALRAIIRPKTQPPPRMPTIPPLPLPPRVLDYEHDHDDDAPSEEPGGQLH